MSSIDDLIDANNPGGVQLGKRASRLSTKSLTDSEKEGLREQGYDVDASDFVDLALDPPKPEVDPMAEARQQAATQLRSVGEVAPVPKQPPPTASNDALQQENQQLKERLKQLEEVLGKIPQTCPQCSWPTGEKPSVEPTKDDVKAFLRSVMAGQVFEKSYRLFGDMVSVTFRTRTGKEESQIKTTIRRVVRQGEIIQQAELLGLVRRLNFICGLKAYTTQETRLDFSEMTSELKDDALMKEDLVGLAEERIHKLPSQLLMVLMRKFDEFSELVEALLAKVNDVGFWKGTES